MIGQHSFARYTPAYCHCICAKPGWTKALGSPYNNNTDSLFGPGLLYSAATAAFTLTVIAAALAAQECPEGLLQPCHAETAAALLLLLRLSLLLLLLLLVHLWLICNRSWCSAAAEGASMRQERACNQSVSCHICSLSCQACEDQCLT